MAGSFYSDWEAGGLCASVVERRRPIEEVDLFFIKPTRLHARCSVERFQHQWPSREDGGVVAAVARSAGNLQGLVHGHPKTTRSCDIGLV